MHRFSVVTYFIKILIPLGSSRHEDKSLNGNVGYGGKWNRIHKSTANWDQCAASGREEKKNKNRQNRWNYISFNQLFMCDANILMLAYLIESVVVCGISHACECELMRLSNKVNLCGDQFAPISKGIPPGEFIANIPCLDHCHVLLHN